MATPNLNVLLTTALASYDNLAPNTPLLSLINPGSLPFGAAGYNYNEYFPAQVAGSTIPLPVAPSFVVYVRNKATTGVVLVTVQFLVLSAVSQCFLGPGDVYLWFDAAKSNGLTLLQLTGLVNPIPCEVYVAG